MINSKYFLALCVLLTVFVATPVIAQLSLSPVEIDINDARQSKTVLVTNNGEPLLPGEIQKIASGVTKTGAALPKGATKESHFSDYSYMFDFDIGDDGQITLIPKQGDLQIGTYDLYVYTTYGTVKGLIHADLRDSIPPLPYQPANLSDFKYDISLPDYVYGQLISIDLKPDNKNTYTWYIDGEVHSSGVGETSFRGWPEAGIHEISYIAQNSDGVIVSQWSDSTVVSKEEAIQSTVRKGYKVPFSAPSGYTQVTWTLDGKLISENHPERTAYDTQLVTFRKKGKHTLSCLAMDSESGNFRQITWSVKVK